MRKTAATLATLAVSAALLSVILGAPLGAGQRSEVRGRRSEGSGPRTPNPDTRDPPFRLAQGGVSMVEPPKPETRSPFDVAYSPDGALLAASDRTAGTLAVIDTADTKVARQVPVAGEPTGVVWSADGRAVFVAEYATGGVAEIDPKAGKVVRRFAVGPRPVGLALAPKRNLLLAANSAMDSVSAVDLATGKERARVPVSREPVAIAVTPDETFAVVANLLPKGDAQDTAQAAALTLIDLEALKPLGDIRLPSGSTCLRDVAVSPDGRWAYAVHTVGRFTLPTTQLERGWINTNALSVIDLGKREVYATVLLDRLSEGAADPWGIALSKDGATAWISLAGVHQLARVDLRNLHALLTGKRPIPKEMADAARQDPSTMNAWLEIAKDTAARKLLVNDLAALYVAGLNRRTNVPGKGPRGLDVSPDGRRVAVATYFAGAVTTTDTAGKVLATVSLGPSREPDAARKGESIFHDATYCFQHWLTCATCHPGGRADGLNWDLLNDGIGNPKNTRSLLWTDRTPPVMAHGVRASMEVAVTAGFRFIQFCEPGPGVAEAVQEYLRALTPETSPYRLPNGDLSAKARRGQAVFESPKTQCLRCHPGPLFTDLKMYDVGTRSEIDSAGEFDNPTCVELWRTAPYLHDGSAVTIEEVFTKFNKHDKHGVTSHLTKEELDDLVEYLLSL